MSIEKLSLNLHSIEQTSKPYTVAYLLKARIVEPDKSPLLDNSCVTCNNGVTVGRGVFCAVCADKDQMPKVKRCKRHISNNA
jgi:hypothetical protein